MTRLRRFLRRLRPDRGRHVHEWFEDTNDGRWCYGCGEPEEALSDPGWGLRVDPRLVKL